MIKKYGSDAPTNHHQLMNYFVDRIAEDLWGLNGESDPTRIDYYKYFAYDRFHETDEGLVNEGFITQDQLDYYKLLNATVNNYIQCPN